MARLPALVETLGAHHPRGVVGVENYARILRKAGKIAPSKRGVGASNVTVTDAANLLFGLAEMNNALHAPMAVDMLRSALRLPPLDGGSDALDFAEDFNIAVNFATLGDLVDSLLTEIAKSPLPQKKSGSGALSSVSIRIQNPSILGAEAVVTFRDDSGASASLTYLALHPDYVASTLADGDLSDRFRKIEAHPYAGSSITFEINFPFDVLLAVAHCVDSSTTPEA